MQIMEKDSHEINMNAQYEVHANAPHDILTEVSHEILVEVSYEILTKFSYEMKCGGGQPTKPVPLARVTLKLSLNIEGLTIYKQKIIRPQTGFDPGTAAEPSLSSTDSASKKAG